MSAEKLSMRKIREVLRLHYDQHLTNREIGRSLGISPETVSYYLRRTKAAQLIWPLSDEWTEDKIYSTLFPQALQSNKKRNYSAPVSR